MEKRKKKARPNKKVNWQRVLTLSAAGNYIQARLNEELEKIAKKL